MVLGHSLRGFAACAILLGGCTSEVVPVPEGTGEYRLVRQIAGPDGGYDYLSVDSEAKRLFVAREFGVMAVDLDSGVVTSPLIEANDVSAVLILPGTGSMLSTVYGEDKAVIFDRATGARQGEIATGKSPDAAAFDRSSGLVFIMNAKSNDVTVIDPSASKAVATIAMGGKPEAAVADGKGRMFVNIEDSAEIAVIDVKRRVVSSRYKLPGCEEPTGIALDPESGTLISACHNRTAKLIDAATGTDRGSVKVGENSDGAIFDAQRRLAYIPSKDGTLTIFGLDPAGKPHDPRTVKTAPGARTAALDPATGRIYLAAAQAERAADGEERQLPGTFRVLVVAPK